MKKLFFLAVICFVAVSVQSQTVEVITDSTVIINNKIAAVYGKFVITSSDTTDQFFTTLENLEDKLEGEQELVLLHSKSKNDLTKTKNDSLKNKGAKRVADSEIARSNMELKKHDLTLRKYIELMKIFK